MYKVGIYLRVRKACFVEGMSVREAARVFGLHRDTVRKMLEYSVPPGYRRQRPARRPKLDPYKGCDGPDPGAGSDLTEEAASHRQAYLRTAQRRTRLPRQVHDSRRLRSRTPSSYPRDVLTSVPPSGTCPVRLRRSSSDHRRSGTQSPLLRPGPPSQRRVLCEGVSRRDDGVILRRTRLPFAFLGGVPQSILYDNTTLAVARILGDGRRQRTRVFSELQSHYLFEDCDDEYRATSARV